MPEMAGVDEPTEEGREAFKKDLSDILKDLIDGVRSGTLPGDLPDTSAITWDAVAAKIIS